MEIIDVIIPTLKPRREVRPLIEEISMTAGQAIEIFATCQPVSAAKNRNLGLEQASSSVIIMVDDDITGLPDGWVSQMVEVMHEHPNCMMASPRLLNPDGSFGIMVGNPDRDRVTGCEVLPGREILTACVALRNTPVRFDENFTGSGFEDNDYSRQLVQQFPKAEFICIHHLRVIHRNEMKKQGGEHWEQNKRYFNSKWNRR